VGKKVKQEPKDIIVPIVKKVIPLIKKRQERKSQLSSGLGNISYREPLMN
jgi:hypothetical protein